jgi:hypothetical protein
MHRTAYEFMFNQSRLIGLRKRVLEIGSRNINGTIKPLFAGLGIDYLGLDISPGPAVDIIADASTWRPSYGQRFDLVVCTEVLEHTPLGQEICNTVYEVLDKGGLFLATMATFPRDPHSADGGPLKSGEYYRNVNEVDLRIWLAQFYILFVDTSVVSDLYVLAVK